jgi:hypothetical protein
MKSAEFPGPVCARALRSAWEVRAISRPRPVESSSPPSGPQSTPPTPSRGLQKRSHGLLSVRSHGRHAASWPVSLQIVLHPSIPVRGFVLRTGREVSLGRRDAYPPTSLDLREPKCRQLPPSRLRRGRQARTRPSHRSACEEESRCVTCRAEIKGEFASATRICPVSRP